jgi:hypothetical protein
MEARMNMRPQSEIDAIEQELASATGPFMPVNVVMTRLCEAAILAAVDKGEIQALATCAAARNVCERGLRGRGTSIIEAQRLADRTVSIIAARLMM